MLGDRKNSLNPNDRGEYAAEPNAPVAGIGFRKVNRRISMADIQPNLPGAARISRANQMDY